MDGVLIAMLVGRFNSANVELFERMMETGVDARDEALMLDFQDVSFFSSAGLRVVLRMARQFAEAGKKFAICALPDAVGELVEVSGFSRVITIYDTQAEAFEALAKGLRGGDV